MPVHTHDEAQLAFAPTGMMQVTTTAGRWLVPSRLAVWVPPQDPHKVEFLSDAELRIIYCRPEAVQAWPPSPPLHRSFALRATPLVEALMSAAFAPGTGSAKMELVVQLLLQELGETLDASTFLPLPTSPVGQRVAHLASADVRHRLTTAELASRAGTSVRTISRVFPAETGMTFRSWRQRARIVSAIDRLSRGDPIGRVSADVGFASTAAFSVAFRAVTGTTPAAFTERRRRT